VELFLKTWRFLRFVWQQKNNFRAVFILLFFFYPGCYTSKKDSLESLYALALQMNKGTKTIQLNVAGDSLSQWSDAFGLQTKLGSKYKVNDYSIAGRSLEDWLFDINTVFQVAPDIVIVELGTNDVMSYSKFRFRENLNRLISEIERRSTAKIILTALPLTEDKGIVADIKTNNDFIRSFSGKYAIADMEKVFEEKKNEVRLYPSFDPIHPNPVGYEIMGTEYMRLILNLGL
jgi:acyl-CoA thioesterase I